MTIKIILGMRVSPDVANTLRTCMPDNQPEILRKQTREFRYKSSNKYNDQNQKMYE